MVFHDGVRRDGRVQGDDRCIAALRGRMHARWRQRRARLAIDHRRVELTHDGDRLAGGTLLEHRATRLQIVLVHGFFLALAEMKRRNGTAGLAQPDGHHDEHVDQQAPLQQTCSGVS